MGQSQSTNQESITLETRIEDPPPSSSNTTTIPKGLALIAHGRLGGTYDQPPVRLLAEYLRDKRQLRVVTWNARGIGNSQGGNEWSGFDVWLGEPGVADYKVCFFCPPFICFFFLFALFCL
jgi:alpha/beta superfamily hydrolase